MKRKRIRRIILISILAFFVIGGLYKLSIEPSDYNKAISTQIKKANTLLDKAKLGNDKGDYSKNNIIKIKNAIAEAEVLVEEEAPDIDDMRKQYKKIKADIKEFKSSSNKNCLLSEELEKIKKENKIFNKEIKVGSNKKVEWNILGSKVKEIHPINLDIETDTVYEEFIKIIAKDNSMKVDMLSFRHNNKLPLEADIKLHNPSKEKKYLYKYNEASNHLVYKSEIQFKNSMASFSIDEGGDWVLSDVKTEVAKVKFDEVKPKNENKDESSKAEKDKAKTSEIAEDKNNTDKNNSDEVNSNKDNANKENKDVKSSNKEINNRYVSNKANNNTNNKTVASKERTKSTSANSRRTKKRYCTIEIRCNTILNNMDRLPKGKASYIPKDGVILPPTKVQIKENENVFDILKRATRSKGIQMEFRNDPLYSGAYVEGINHLYEFDGGELSGWMYKVNGWFPNYGCSRYNVKENDYISWNYTCNLGKDVGDQDYSKYNKD